MNYNIMQRHEEVHNLKVQQQQTNELVTKRDVQVSQVLEGSDRFEAGIGHSGAFSGVEPVEALRAVA